MLKTLGVRTTFGGSDVASLHYTTLHYTRLHSTTLQPQLHNYTPLHSTTLHYTKLHSTTLHYLPLHFTTLHYTTLHCTTLQLQLQLHNYTTTLHYTKLHYTTLHYITLHSTTGWLRWFCMFMREVERSGRWFPERGYILEYQECRFAKRILRSRSTLDRWGRKIAERIGTRVWVQHWSFHFWRKFRRSGSSLMLST